MELYFFDHFLLWKWGHFLLWKSTIFYYGSRPFFTMEMGENGV